LVSGAKSERPVKGRGSMEEVGRGVDVSVREVSPPKRLIGKGRHFSRDYIVVMEEGVCMNVWLSLILCAGGF
jgi:hypothetical protein